jgi:hypothetical protein
VDPAAQFSYVVPVRWADGEQREELARYLRRLGGHCGDLIVVDGSPGPVFEANAAAWGKGTTHLAPDPAEACLNGKVAGVRTGVRLAAHEHVVIADDDVRYDPASLRRTLRLLDEYDLVRPQNYFQPLPWHACWDTARTLLNRGFGRDYPGTLAVRRSRLLAIGCYDGDVLFENLELIRTVAADGGRIASPLDLYVARRPPTASHFWSQRIRQAYDDFAIPARMASWLAIPPLLALAGLRGKPRPPAALALLSVALAEYGRRRAGGRRVFPPRASLLAPVWILERALCSWLAVAQRLRFGGARYAGQTIKVSAHSEARLRRRREALRASAPP